MSAPGRSCIRSAPIASTASLPGRLWACVPSSRSMRASPADAPATPERALRRALGRFGTGVGDVRARALPGADRLAGLDVRVDGDGVPRLADAVAFLLVEPVDERTL